MRIIAINGPKQSGKTTFANGLEEELRLLQPDIHIEQRHFKTPLIALLEAFRSQVHGEDFDLDSAYAEYEQLKEADFLGHSGREWMVAISQGIKSIDPVILPRILFSSLPIMNDDSILIIDDLGTEAEYMSLYTQPFVNEINIVYMEKRGARLYSHGEMYGDARQCLRGHAGGIDPDPKEYAEELLPLTRMS